MPLSAYKRKNNMRIMMGIDCWQETAYYKKITKRESDIMCLIARGLKNTEIAVKLELSVRTIEAHRFRLIKKLKLKSASQLVICAVDYAQMQKNKKNIIFSSLLKKRNR